MAALPPTHAWDVSPAEAEAIQRRLAGLVVRDDRLPPVVRTVAGVDVAYGTRGDDRVFAGVVVIDVNSLETIEARTAGGMSTFPYVPGLFAFRELPHLLAALDQVACVPDLVICDGHGIAHPRRCGLASHLGVLLDIPTVGCAKTPYVGEFESPGAERGCSSRLREQGEVIGSALRTRAGVKPVFVSVGHRVSLESATGWVLRLARGYRQPEPIRRAHALVSTLRASS